VNLGRLDVVRRRGANVRSSRDSLNHHLWHTESIQVASSPAVPRASRATEGFCCHVRRDALRRDGLTVPSRIPDTDSVPAGARD
jgi:hypothetical protein